VASRTHAQRRLVRRPISRVSASHAHRSGPAL